MSLDTKQFEDLELMLRSHGIILGAGLSDRQIEQAEQRWGIRFPPDLAQMLSRFVPCSKGFYNWDDQSQDSVSSIKNALYWPVEGILFDVEKNNFWMRDWGERPAQIEEALQVAKIHLAKVPKLIPIYQHRYLPSEPNEANNPIFSVWQTDIIYYGSNIYEYFEMELRLIKHSDIQFDKIKKGIPFWGYLLE